MSQNISLDYIHPYCDVVRWQIQCLQGKVTNTGLALGCMKGFLNQGTGMLEQSPYWHGGFFGDTLDKGKIQSLSSGRWEISSHYLEYYGNYCVSHFCIFPLLFWPSVNCKELKKWKMKLPLLGNIVFLIIHKSTLILRFKLTLVDISQLYWMGFKVSSENI